MKQMAVHTKPDSRNAGCITGDSGSSAKGVLFVLLALAVCFGYFYFFTDILRSKQGTSEQSDVYTGEVRKPLPERSDQLASGSAGVAEPTAPATPALSPAGKQLAENPPPIPGGGPQQQPSVTAPAVPSPNIRVQVPAAGTPASAGAPAVKKPLKSPDMITAKAANNKTLPAKPAGFASKRISVDSNAAKSSAATVIHKEKAVSTPKTAAIANQKATAKPPVTSKNAEAHSQPKGSDQSAYTLVVGTYVLKSSLLADKEKLEKAGLSPVVNEGKKRSEPMNRVLVSELNSYPEAQVELARVKKISSDAFLLKGESKFQVYAGSYYKQERAVEVQERLRKQGLVPILKKSMVAVSTYTLSVGSYPTRDASLKDAARLQKLGFKPLPTAKQ